MGATAVLADATVGFPILTSLIVVPAAGALLVVCVPNSRHEVQRLVAVLASVTTAALTAWLVADFESPSGEATGDLVADAGFQYVTNQPWISDAGISWLVGIDGISLFLVALTAGLFPIALLATRPGHDSKPYYAWLLVLEAGCIGVFVALDLFLFFVMFEIVLVPMYFIIGKWGHDNRVYAATKFFLYTMLGSALMLVGILSLVFLHASATGSDVTFNLVELAENQALATTTARWIFLSFAVAFAVKVPLAPLHTWLSDAHTEAPTAGSVILAGVLLKLGTYGFLRFGLYLFPEASVYFAPLLITLGTVGIIYGAVVATMQRDLKRLVAYSSIAHLGFIVLGTFALNTQGIEGGVLQMVNHGVSTGALFLLVGMIYEHRHTREIVRLKGLQRSAPIMAGVFSVVMLSSIGLPGLNGFVGEFLILLGAFLAHRWWAVVATAGVILAALYLLWAYQRVFHGTPDEENADFAEMTFKEGLVMLPLLVVIVFMGVYPKPVLDRIEPAVERLLGHVSANVDDFEEPTATNIEVVGADEGAGG